MDRLEPIQNQFWRSLDLHMAKHLAIFVHFTANTENVFDRLHQKK
jgi:hypothetical protein